MATLVELADLSANPDLQRKVRVATVIAAQTALAASPGTVEGRKWALEVMSDPKMWGNRILLSVLAANAGLTATQITNATDAAIQSGVNAVAGPLASAYSGV